jgi:hypothetical protein
MANKVKLPWELGSIIKFYNITYEKRDLMINSVPFSFESKKITEVPEKYAKTVYEKLKGTGVFPIFNNYTEEDIKEATRQAYIDYCDIELATRIKNFESYYRMYKKSGINLPEDREFTKAKRWKNEIEKSIDKLGGRDKEQTFDSENDAAIFQPDSQLFSRDVLIKQNNDLENSSINEIVEGVEEEILDSRPKQRGRPPKNEAFK